MLAKRTKTPTVFTGAIALIALYGCSLKDYDYLGAGNKPPDDETQEPEETETTEVDTSADASVETPSQSTDVSSEPDASVTTAPVETEISSSTSTTEITSSSPPFEPSSEPTTSVTETSVPPIETTAGETSEPSLPPLVVEGNLITNSSFESGITPWVPFGNAVILTSSDEVHTGEMSLLCAGRGQATYQSASLALLPLLEEGKSYRLQVWARVTTSTSTGITFTAKAPCIPDSGVIDTTDPTNYLQLGSGLVRSDKWSQVSSAVFELPTCNLAEFTLYFDGVPVNEDYYIDDISLVEVTP